MAAKQMVPCYNFPVTPRTGQHKMTSTNSSISEVTKKVHRKVSDFHSSLEHTKLRVDVVRINTKSNQKNVTMGGRTIDRGETELQLP